MGYSWPVKKKGTNKYNAMRTAGFGSKLEASVYQLLLFRQKVGEIKDIKQQVSVDLSCGINWKVDFQFYDRIRKRTMYAEAKGIETERYRICLKLWRGGHGPGPLEIYKGSYKSPKLVDIIYQNLID